MKYIALKTSDGNNTGKLSLYCRALKVSRQGFYKYLRNRDKPWKYADVAEMIRKLLASDEYNASYGRKRIYKALLLYAPPDIEIPSERTVYRIMQRTGLVHKRRRSAGITKADRNAEKSDDLLKRDFSADKPFDKCVTDITEVKGSDGKLYVSVIFDCFDNEAIGLALRTNMKAGLCVETLESAYKAHPELRGAIIHSDRGSQYTSRSYRHWINYYDIRQSMNSAGGRCHDNAKCESMCARMKSELFYDRGLKSENFTIAELRVMIWRYFMIYWNKRRICSANEDGLPPEVKRLKFSNSTGSAA
jgi:transposase InsO family protein